MAVLITRPAHQAGNLRAELARRGMKYLLFPTLEIAPLPVEAWNQSLFTFPTVQKIIFVSANAVAPLLPFREFLLKATQIFAIGPGTGRTLQDYNIQARTPALGQFHSEGLLSLPELQLVAGENIIIFSGEGGRTLLAEVLAQRGALLRKIAVYQRICPELPLSTLHQWQNGLIHCIISTSTESLQNLYQMVGVEGRSWLCQQRLLVVSEAMTLLAQALGFRQKSILAENASDGAILAALMKN